MADSFIDVEESATPTKSVDTESLLVAAKTVQRERQQITGALAAEIAVVKTADPVGGDHGLVVLPKVPTTGLFVAGPIVHNIVATSVNPLLVGGYASSTPPVAVDADGDAVRAWFFRTGALAVNVAEQLATIDVEGETSDGVIQGGKPVSVGGLARNADKAAVDNGDAVRLMADLLGKLVTLPYALPGELVDGEATLTTTSNVSVIAAPGAGSRNYITSVSGSNTDAASDVRVDIKNGTTIFVSFFCAAGGGGFSHSMPAPKRLDDNAVLNMALSGAVTDVRVSAQGYKAAA